MTNARVLGKIRQKGLKGTAKAALRRMAPNSPRFGFSWVTLPDGSVTFRERGFVEASTPSMLLARHNYEIERIASFLQGVSVEQSLEIGCGYGRLSPIFGRYSQHHIAIDINEDALSLARATYPEIDFRLGSGDGLPFAGESFGLVCTWTVLQHVPESRLSQVADEIARVLTPEGILLICEETRFPNAPSGHSWHRSVEAYQQLFPTLSLQEHSAIEELNRIKGMSSPGEVMLFRRNT